MTINMLKFVVLVTVFYVGGVSSNDGCAGQYCRVQRELESCAHLLTDFNLVRPELNYNESFVGSELSTVYNNFREQLKAVMIEEVDQHEELRQCLEYITDLDVKECNGVMDCPRDCDAEKTHCCDSCTVALGEKCNLPNDVVNLPRTCEWIEPPLLGLSCGAKGVCETDPCRNVQCPVRCVDDTHSCCNPCYLVQDELCGLSGTSCQAPLTCTEQPSERDEEPPVSTCQLNCIKLVRHVVLKESMNDEDFLDVFASKITWEFLHQNCPDNWDLLSLKSSDPLITEKIGETFDCLSNTLGDKFLEGIIGLAYNYDKTTLQYCYDDITQK